MNALQIVSLLLGSVAISVSMGYFWTLWRKKHVELPKPGTMARIKSGPKLYRARFVSAEKDYWRFGSLLSRGEYSPLTESVMVSIEVPTNNGAYLFRGRIMSIDPSGVISVEPPQSGPINRRHEPRIHPQRPVEVEGREGVIADLSPLGARISTKCDASAGDRVRLDFERGCVYGWVLEAQYGTGPNTLRVRFEEIVDLCIAG